MRGLSQEQMLIQSVLDSAGIHTAYAFFDSLEKTENEEADE